MRQRNVGSSPLIVPDIPAEVLPGDEVDFPSLLAGFEPVTEPAPDKPAKKTTTKADPSAASTEGA